MKAPETKPQNSPTYRCSYGGGCTICHQLAKANWEDFCGSLKGTHGTKRTWKILRAILGPTSTKNHMHTTTQRLIYLEEQKGTGIMAHIKKSLHSSAPTGRSERTPFNTLRSGRELGCGCHTCGGKTGPCLYYTGHCTKTGPYNIQGPPKCG